MKIPELPPIGADVPLDDWRERAFRASCNPPIRHCEVSPEPGQKWAANRARIMDALQAAGSVVCVSGPRGGGKTQAAVDIMRELHKRNVFPLYRTALEFFYLLRATFGSDTSEGVVMAQHISPALLVLDEVQVRGETAFELDRLTYLVDARYRANRRTLLITNLPPRAKASGGPCVEDSLGASIISRMTETGALILFDGDNWRAGK